MDDAFRLGEYIEVVRKIDDFFVTVVKLPR